MGGGGGDFAGREIQPRSGEKPRIGSVCASAVGGIGDAGEFYVMAGWGTGMLLFNCVPCCESGVED